MWKGYVLFGEIAPKTNHYYYYHKSSIFFLLFSIFEGYEMFLM